MYSFRILLEGIDWKDLNTLIPDVCELEINFQNPNEAKRSLRKRKNNPEILRSNYIHGLRLQKLKIESKMSSVVKHISFQP